MTVLKSLLLIHMGLVVSCPTAQVHIFWKLSPLRQVILRVAVVLILCSAWDVPRSWFVLSSSSGSSTNSIDPTMPKHTETFLLIFIRFCYPRRPTDFATDRRASIWSVHLLFNTCRIKTFWNSFTASSSRSLGNLAIINFQGASRKVHLWWPDLWQTCKSERLNLLEAKLYLAKFRIASSFHLLSNEHVYPRFGPTYDGS